MVIGLPGAGYKQLGDAQHLFWEWTSGSVEEQQELLTSEPSQSIGLTFDWAKPMARNILPLFLLEYEGLYPQSI